MKGPDFILSGLLRDQTMITGYKSTSSYTWIYKVTTFLMSFAITDRLCLIRQPLGSCTFAHISFRKKLKDKIAYSIKLLLVVSDYHTILRVFTQCTLHKLIQLLCSEVIYEFDDARYKRRDN